jgi:hypothetical protein
LNTHEKDIEIKLREAIGLITKGIYGQNLTNIYEYINELRLKGRILSTITLTSVNAILQEVEAMRD